MFDLAGTQHRLTGLVSFLSKRGDVGDVHAEEIRVGGFDLGHAFQAGPEGAPEHVSSVLAVCDGVEAAFLLEGDDVFDVLVFDRLEVRGVGFPGFPGVAGVEELLCAEEGTEMFGAEGWIAVEFCRHDEKCSNDISRFCDSSCVFEVLLEIGLISHASCEKGTKSKGINRVGTKLVRDGSHHRHEYSRTTKFCLSPQCKQSISLTPRLGTDIQPDQSQRASAARTFLDDVYAG